MKRIIPTGSFKSRGSSVGTSKAKELRIKQLAMPTNGNVGAACYIQQKQKLKLPLLCLRCPASYLQEVYISEGDLHLIQQFD